MAEEIENIRISIVGWSGAGKTAYLAALYSQMSTGVNGFTFTPTDYERRLGLGKKWDRIVDQRQWPPCTSQSLEYDFLCKFQQNDFIRFSCHDYRGGDIFGRGSERRELIHNFRSSSALIFCIPADEIQRAIVGDPDYIHSLRRSVLVLNDCRYANDGPIPVVLMIGKSDIFSGPQEFNKAKDFLISGPFRPVFEEGAKWVALIVGVSLGYGLSIGYDNNVLGRIHPVNIHLPVIFSLYATMLKKLRRSPAKNVDFVRNHFSRVEGLENVIGALRDELFCLDEEGFSCVEMYFDGKVMGPNR